MQLISNQTSVIKQLLQGLLAAAVLVLTAAGPATAHAFLDRAVPGVGSTVQAVPAELTLSFTQNVVIAFSGVTLKQESGGAIPVAKPVADAASPATLHVRLPKGLRPGTYIVNWHVVSVDTHATSGTYRFTVAP